MTSAVNEPVVSCISRNKWQVTHKGLKWIFGSELEANAKAAELLATKKKKRKK